jgi:hypothetical protein
MNCRSTDAEFFGDPGAFLRFRFRSCGGGFGSFNSFFGLYFFAFGTLLGKSGFHLTADRGFLLQFGAGFGFDPGALGGLLADLLFVG